MKKIFSIAFALALSTFAIVTVNASEISDKFKELLPNIGAVDLSARAKAQQEWQTICLKSSADSAKRAEAVKLMTEQLNKNDVNGETAISFLSVLGLIGDAAVVPTIKKFLGNREIKFVDETLAKEGKVLITDEAVRALARIPSRSAVTALSSTNSIYARSGLIAQEKRKKVKIGVENKMPMAIPYATQKEVDRYVSNFAAQNDVVKTQIIVGLGIRGDAKYANLIKESIKSPNNGLRQAAITAIAKLNSGEVVEPLIDLLLGDDADSVQAAGLALSTFANKQVDTKLIEILQTETDAKRFNLASDVLVKRKTAEFLPLLLTKLKSNTVPDRKTAIGRAVSMASAENFADFIDLWLVVSDRNEQNEIEKVIAKFANGDATAVVAKRTPQNNTKMYSLLGRIGDPKTLPDLRKTLTETSPEALSMVIEWPDAAVAKDLIDIVQGNLGEYSVNDKIKALRSYIRVISLPQDKLGIKVTVEEQVEFLANAFKLATQDEERNLVLRRLGSVRHVKSLNFIVGQIDNEKLFESAVTSILDLAHHAQLRRQDAQTFKDALDLVIKRSKNRGQIDRANSYLNSF
ncbi:MAG: HEAT repeat domain-containing protein [Planctomycetaceae bacterium]|nr:HEAT repeat domain-containing protein [Planctomycetaceae bacterium]